MARSCGVYGTNRKNEMSYEHLTVGTNGATETVGVLGTGV
jgi:hypothetical protein